MKFKKSYYILKNNSKWTKDQIKDHILKTQRKTQAKDTLTFIAVISF